MEVEQFFFRKDTFKIDFQSLVEEVRKYPNNYEFSEEIDRQFRAKAKYLLKLLRILPERAFEYENLFFNIYGFIEDKSMRCDRICHLVIDFISYFETQKNDEELVGEVFQTVTALIKF